MGEKKITTIEKAVVLLSGGLDSATTAAVAGQRGFDVHALTIDYGQRHRIELEAASQIAKALNVAKHVLTCVDLRVFGGSALTARIDVPKSAAAPHCIPVTYVPARNTVFLALALAYAETLGSRDVFIGANAVDYSGYPDCRPEFIAAFERLAGLATKAGVEGAAFTIHAPLISMSKADIIRLGTQLGVDFSLTHSCYDPTSSGLACGQCESCRLRREGFQSAGLIDPLHYAHQEA